MVAIVESSSSQFFPTTRAPAPSPSRIVIAEQRIAPQETLVAITTSPSTCIPLVSCSRDPLGYASEDKHLYRYVNGKPFRFVDPSGLFGDDFVWPMSVRPTMGPVHPIRSPKPPPPPPIAYPRTKDECCKEARKLKHHISDVPGKTIYGKTVCCDGLPVGCVFHENLPYSNPIAKKLITDCIQRHEDKHVEHMAGLCPKKKCDLRKVSVPLWYNARSECLATKESLDCLTSAIAACTADPTCDATEVISDYDRALKRHKEYCKLTGMKPAY